MRSETKTINVIYSSVDFVIKALLTEGYIVRISATNHDHFPPKSVFLEVTLTPFHLERYNETANVLIFRQMPHIGIEGESGFDVGGVLVLSGYVVKCSYHKDFVAVSYQDYA